MSQGIAVKGHSNYFNEEDKVFSSSVICCLFIQMLRYYANAGKGSYLKNF